jgi:hypothetical protein
MTSAQLAMFSTLVAAVIGFWLALFHLFPRAARAKFQYRATVLRDECMDAVLDGRLRRAAPVEAFLDLADAMATRPDFFSLTRAWAVHRTMKRLNWKVQPPSHDSLKPEERELLDRLDEQLEKAFVQRLVLGSSFGWLFWLASVAVPHVLRLKGRSEPVNVVATPQHLARDYSAASETVPIKRQELVGLSTDI